MFNASWQLKHRVKKNTSIYYRHTRLDVVFPVSMFTQGLRKSRIVLRSDVRSFTFTVYFVKETVYDDRT